MKWSDILTERELPLESDANFRHWFRKSVVVDQHGQPLTMYHGTFRDFDEFFIGSHFGDKDAANQRWHNVANGERDRYAGNHGIVYPVYLSIQNPLRIVDDKGLSDGYDLCRAALNAGAITPDEDQTCQDTGSPALSKRRLFKLLAQRGYDGLVYQNTVEGNADSFVPFRANQVKSVFNSGSYSSMSNHMHESTEPKLDSRQEIADKWRSGQNFTPAEAIIMKSMLRSDFHAEVDQRTDINAAPNTRLQPSAQTEQLRQILLSHGGSTASIDPTDPDLTKLIERGFIMNRRGIKFMKGQPINCHGNMAGLWKRGLARICTGYSLARDGQWRQHSWGLTEQDEIIETTTRGRVGYFGIVLTDEESKDFAKHN